MIKNYIKFQKKLFFSNIEFGNHKSLFYLFSLLLLSVIINFSARFYEKSIWDKNPSIFNVNDEPLVRTGDPAYFVNIAQYLKDNKPLNKYYYKLNFPNEYEDIIDPPLISVIISYLSKDASLEEIVKASNKLILFSSVMTCFGIFFLFYAIGRPYEGIIASLGGGISTDYFFRSSIGYIDTDILNLFFIYLLFGLIYMSSKNQSLTKGIFFIILAGVIGRIFYIWYPKPELILMSFFSLVFFTSLNTKSLKIISSHSVIFILLTGPNIYLNSFSIFFNSPYLKEYLSANINIADLVNTTKLNFNSIFSYIAEQQKPSILRILSIEGSFYLGLICFFGIFLWAITYPILFIGLAPLSLFFLLSFILGYRALFYSGPFFWFGAIYLINFICFKFISQKKIQINKEYIYLITTMFLMIFLSISTKSFTRDIVKTYIPNEVTKAFVSLNKLIKDRDDSIIVAQWTYGYQSLLYNDISILIHPGVPASPRHYFIARAYSSHSLEETSKVLNYVAQGKVERLNNNNIDTFQALSKDIYNTKKIDKDIYLVLTDQQKDWFRTQGATAYWDIEKNKPLLFEGKTALDILAIDRIYCEKLDVRNFQTTCKDKYKKNISIDLSSGLFDGEPLIRRVVQVVDGLVDINHEYENTKGNIVFQIIKNTKDQSQRLYIMHEAVFKSSYNKLFHLNDSLDYDLIYNDYPHVKVYKIK
jgi:dolichyl-diphosphooligosaccharide--protein glycosyltransferase